MTALYQLQGVVLPPPTICFKKINNVNEYKQELGDNENNGANLMVLCTNYKFVIKSKSINKQNPVWCGAYEAGNLCSSR